MNINLHEIHLRKYGNISCHLYIDMLLLRIEGEVLNDIVKNLYEYKFLTNVKSSSKYNVHLSILLHVSISYE